MLQADILMESALRLKSFLYKRFGSYNSHLQTLSKHIYVKKFEIF